MTEEQWLSGVFPERMFRFYELSMSERKKRLFACGCCRRIWDELTDERSRTAVIVAERYADGEATIEELTACHRPARKVSFEQPLKHPLKYVVIAPADAAFPRTADVLAVVLDAGWSRQSEIDGCSIDFRGIAEMAHLMRDVVGNPFRAVAFDDARTIPRAVELARIIYEERSFDRMPELADILEGAGCYSDDILNHCRNGEPHIRGCWVVDGILGKR